MVITKDNLARMIDHTILKSTAQEMDIITLCQEAAEYNFVSVCVNPFFVPLAVEKLKDTEVLVCTVVGFPLGANSTTVKTFETEEAVRNGAMEIDMVINVGALKAGRENDVLTDIKGVVVAARSVNPDAIVKVIIETCYLTQEEKILACQLASKAGAHFVKTSTGFGTGGATVQDIALMRKIVGERLGVKASGGIKNAQHAIDMIEAGANRIGASAGVAILKELC